MIPSICVWREKEAPVRSAACEKSNGTLSHRYPIRGSNHSSHSLLTAIRPAALTGSVISVPRAVPARRSLQTATNRAGSAPKARRLPSNQSFYVKCVLLGAVEVEIFFVFLGASEYR